MLSTSHSGAGERLRRAKSIPSPSPPAQQRPAAVAPQHVRHQAEAAAVEAYERARRYDELTSPTSRPRRNRRRSQLSGRSEGSHFEEARRRSVNQVESVRPKPSTASSSATAQTRASLPSQTTTHTCSEEKVITRRRSVIPPALSTNDPTCSRAASFSTARQSRQRQSVDTGGSPAPRYSQCIKDRQVALQLRARGNAIALESDSPASPPPSPPKPARPSIRETQTDEDIRKLATNAYLHDIEQKRVRERKSFIFSTFQKRRATASDYDTSLPPFNYANDGGAAPIPPNPATSAPVIVTEPKTRHFSSSIKTRLKNAFRKSSRTVSGMPAQHVEAKHFHFALKDYDPSEESGGPDDFADPFMTIAAEEPRVASHSRPTSKISTTIDGSAKSRVTSWTNSTVAAFSSIRTNAGPSQAKEQTAPPILQRKDSKHSLRKNNSFLAEPIRSKLRRVSRADLKGSGESVGLYTALQKRIRSSKSVDPIQKPLISAPLPTTVELLPTADARASLPSQQHFHVDDARNEWASTVRTITPDPAPYGIDVPSPVHEVTSPAPSNDDADATVLHHAVHGSGGSSTQSGLKRRSAVKAPPPSHDALARRMERASNRWKSPLDELSPIGMQATTKLSDDNPYELRSLSQCTKQVTPGNDLTQGRKAGNLLSPRSDVISPSVYSRATDGASPRPDSPDVYEPTTTITITGHEVRRYSISPSKRIDDKGQRGHGSGTWRRWLSDEMNTSLGANEKHIRLPHNILMSAPAQRQDSGVSSLTAVPGHKRSIASITAELRSVSPLSVHSDDRPGSRASSQVPAMNGRYPAINASRNASLHSVATSRRTSPPPTRPHSPEGRLLHSVAMAKKPSIDAALHSTSSVHTRAKPRSQSALETKQTNKPLSHVGGDRLSAAAASMQAGRTCNRPKSAYELRVNYKPNAQGPCKRLAVQRKAILNNDSMLGDSTLFNIAAGPYAHQSPSTNQDKARPTDSPLQSLSSSEWLAAGSSKKRDGRRLTAGPLTPVSQGHGARKARSPGQRLVTNWLDERKSRENLPPSKESTAAFV